MEATIKPTPRNTIAFFGSTGATGKATLQILLEDPRHSHLQHRLFVRSKAKLLGQFPKLATNPNMQIWEGQLGDVAAIKECINGAGTIICTLGENSNIPNLHVLQDAAKSIIQALEELQKSKKAATTTPKPRLLLLSAITMNKRLSGGMAWPLLYLVKQAFYWTYWDLGRATRMFEQASPDLLSLVLLQPPAIVESAGTGHEITVESDKPPEGPIVSYADLGAAFAEIATQTDEYAGVEAVGVSSPREDPRKWTFELLSRIVTGLISGNVPGYWSLVRLLGR